MSLALHLQCTDGPTQYTLATFLTWSVWLEESGSIHVCTEFIHFISFQRQFSARAVHVLEKTVDCHLAEHGYIFIITIVCLYDNDTMNVMVKQNLILRMMKDRPEEEYKIVATCICLLAHVYLLQQLFYQSNMTQRSDMGYNLYFGRHSVLKLLAPN